MVFAYVRRTTASYRRGVAVSVAAATFLCSSVTAYSTDALSVEGTIPLGDIRGRIDHLAADVSRRRLYVAQNKDQLSKISRIATAGGARTGLFVPETDRLYVAGRAGLGRPAAVWVLKPGE